MCPFFYGTVLNYYCTIILIFWTLNFFLGFHITVISLYETNGNFHKVTNHWMDLSCLLIK